jgi:hypothetical protein
MKKYNVKMLEQFKEEQYGKPGTVKREKLEKGNRFGGTLQLSIKL